MSSFPSNSHWDHSVRSDHRVDGRQLDADSLERARNILSNYQHDLARVTRAVTSLETLREQVEHDAYHWDNPDVREYLSSVVTDIDRVLELLS